MDKEAKAAKEGSNVYVDLEELSSPTKKKVHCTSPNKNRDKDEMINFMREVAESLKDFVQANRKRVEGNGQAAVQEVLAEVEMINDIDEEQSYKAINWFIENSNKIEVLKALLLTKKKKYLLASMYVLRPRSGLVYASCAKI
ncbi:unnamed protein product [Trifolium pratense]|uniref:Uncharacterized protein n=1 Tax=Trifolium pratense TaxID=57577 RepID=A0ACB0L621_TRIPR|nr:unnamed protein product [Trifolium pratense]